MAGGDAAKGLLPSLKEIHRYGSVEGTGRGAHLSGLKDGRRRGQGKEAARSHECGKPFRDEMFHNTVWSRKQPGVMAGPARVRFGVWIALTYQAAPLPVYPLNRLRAPAQPLGGRRERGTPFFHFVHCQTAVFEAD